LQRKAAIYKVRNCRWYTMKIVLRIGGSILGAPPSSKIVREYKRVISTLVSEGNSVGVVVGGGRSARRYIKSAKSLKLSHSQQDTVAIAVSRLNASIVSMAFGVGDKVPLSVGEAVAVLSKKKVMVMGGLKPGITTDTVATLLANRWKADLFIKGSDQEGIYTSDPRKDKNSVKLDKITYAQLVKIIGTKHTPGIHSIVDPVAAGMLARSKTKLIVFNGKKPENVTDAVHGRKIGTLVVSR